jgi:hypothetical protein
VKNILLLITAVVTLSVFSGCDKQPDTPKNNKKCKYTSDMTSKQVEKKMKWKYCEESN